LSPKRRSLAEYGTFVFFRRGLVLSASFRNSRSRSIAALRFAFCVRNFCETTLIAPFLFARVASRSSICCFCVSDKLPQFNTSNNSVIRVLTLLIFCPPGPLLRDALKIRSSSRISMSSVISIIVLLLGQKVIRIGRGIAGHSRRIVGCR